MNLIETVRAECVATAAEPADKEEVLRAVARLAKLSPVLAEVPEATILQGLQAREALGSTGFGKGIAIPHCRLESIDEFVVGLMSIRDGADFDALDGDKVSLVAFIIAPESDADNHIRMLSAISQTLSIPGAIDELTAQKSPETLRESFLRLTRDDSEDSEHTTMSLFHVLVQDEDRFRDILEILTAAESNSIAVLEAENTRAYLARMPLFAGFWSDSAKGFNRLIVAVVEKRLANETVRRIESVTGSLDTVKGVLVTVQDLIYCSGSIGP